MFTLFNLQGTFRCFDRFSFLLHRSFELGAELFYLSTFKPFCQELFSNSFRSFSVLTASLEAACIYYYTKPLLSTTFFPFFRTFYSLDVFTKHTKYSPSPDSVLYKLPCENREQCYRSVTSYMAMIFSIGVSFWI